MLKKSSKILVAFFLFLFITSFKIETEKYPPLSSFPQPKGIENMLFYIQRAKDINTIVYQLNIDKDNNLVEENPINAYWIRYAEDGRKMGLTMIQQKFAYGINVKLINKENKIYQFNFVSYKKRNFYLKKSLKDKKFHVYGHVNHQLARIDNLFVNIQGGSFWFPKIEYVAINGKDIENNTALVERVIP